ncbi:hypothetical protein EXIGLDRAFT_788494 [Exidia glandulosa HHB12029]|uniref:Integrase catalytic domain-containing protein n=1 Tax=Exidia glandulosa HHB12029 TaxID=1314781 RepID=A0A165IEA0_EXIGL|nr:hypothetical protein EXIGLDRAFT_788494 [Exidia glandulosa HHB12029]
MAPNSKGTNQYGDKNWPPDDVLQPELYLYAMERLTIDEKRDRFFKRFGISIGKTALCAMNKKFNTPSVRKPMALDLVVQQIMEEADKDAHGRRGSEVVRTNLRRRSNLLVPRRVVRETLALNQPDVVEARMPGNAPPRKPLRALGPDHQHHSDGWEKIGALAIRMGGVGVPVYATKDQYSSKYLQGIVVPNDRLEDVIVHTYLDRVAAVGGIPITEVTDLGSEHGVWRNIAQALRSEYAPDLDPEIAPPTLGLKSTQNTPIESGWRGLREYSGHNLFSAMTAGEGLFNPACMLQRCLFFWIWPPIVQGEVDDFIAYWNVHRIPYNAEKVNPSGVPPNHAYAVPEKLTRYPGQHCLIPVPRARIEEIRAGLHLTREQALSFVSPSFDRAARQVYTELHLPRVTLNNAWQTFIAMMPGLTLIYPHRNPEPAFVFTL